MYVVMSLKALASDVFLEMNQAPKLSMYKNKLSNQHQEKKRGEKKENKKKKKRKYTKDMILNITLIFFLPLWTWVLLLRRVKLTHFSVKGSILC